MRPIVEVDSESVRLTEVRSLDIDALRPHIERVCRLARAVAGVPIAYVSLAEKDHVWQSAFEGHPEGRLPREVATTMLVLERGCTIWAADARAHAPDHPWVRDAPYMRFYLGTPLRLRSGVCIGALAIASPQVREADEALIQRMEDLAALVADEIERLRTERQLAAAESAAGTARRLMESFVQSAPVALAMLDRDLRFTQVSPRWCEEHKIQAADVVGHTMGELFPVVTERFAHLWRAALAGQTVRRDRLHIPSAATPSGPRWIRAEVCPWLDGEGAVAGLLLMTTELSEMINSLERAESSEKSLRMAIEIADVLVYELDFRAQTLKVDGAQDTFFPAPLTFDAFARDIWSTVHPDDRAEAMARWDRHMAEGVPFRTEYRINRTDGREVWAFSAAEMMYDEDGRPERLIGVLKNITDRRRSEAAVMAARDAAEAANRAKSEFLANMSHEIRTPLNGVIGVAAALARTPLSPQQTEMVELIEGSGRTLEAILSDVLDFSRIESGRLELKPEGFDLDECLRSAAALFEPEAREKGLAFGIDIAPEARGGFEGDPVRIRQIVCNLLSNAVKFTSEGGVALSARANDEAAGARIVITVTDTGIGFEPSFRARLFDRFEQADGSITRRFGGSGLGLAISASLAEVMGGVLDAESTPGHGASFTLTLTLPRTALAPRLALAAESWTGEALRAREDRAPRVLLAEDHAVNRRVVELILEAAGVELVCVENGAEAVQAAQAGGFDLVLMDMQMPVMDGLSAIRAIRAAERSRGASGLPIWALSANALPEHIIASHTAGADGHLTKPVRADALLSVIFEAYGGAESQALSA